MIRQILQHIGRIADDIVAWRPAAPNESVCERFSPDEWHKIADDIHSDKEWQQFVRRYDFVHVFVCSLRSTGEPFGFIYLFEEEPPKPVVSFHGGCWDTTHPAVCCRGLILLIDRLLSKGIKVRTSCNNHNTNAFRFLQAVGCVPYFRGTEYTYMWINSKRLHNSTIYKRLYHSKPVL